jgi:hypothetical protein
LSGCHLVLAERIQRSNENGRNFGVYANAPLVRGVPISLPAQQSDIAGDLVLHLIDIPEDDSTNGMSQLSKWVASGYLLDATSSGYGGNFEGNGRVLTALPGFGMLASSYVESEVDGPNHKGDATTSNIMGGPNIWASIPTADEANHPRRYSPVAGSFALNYNLTFRATRSLDVGEEILVDRSGWFRRNSFQGQLDKNPGLDDANQTNQYSNGVCVDTLIYPAHAKNGRGAFASKFIPNGSIVAYSPILPLPREELRYLRKKERKKKDVIWRDQLLLNYCFGHKNSSVLLFPYGQFVNFINHAPSLERLGSDEAEAGVANVQVRWSDGLCRSDSTRDNEVDPRIMTPAELWNRSSLDGLVLEYIALQDIQPNEEILLDYGPAWSTAWEEHVKRWKNDPLNHVGGPDATSESTSSDYSPAYIMEDVISNLRTAKEQLQFPYPDNVFTACFYRYDRSDEVNGEVKSSARTLNEATPWKMSRGLFDMTNLRPCKVIAREPATDRNTGQQQGSKNFYTAIIQNRPGLSENERIPKGVKHIVSGIPREAFRFVDRPYSSDEHLEGAFRHAMGLEETGIFPESWFDKA